VSSLDVILSGRQAARDLARIGLYWVSASRTPAGNRVRDPVPHEQTRLP
jgi:hypothetical protein